MGSDHNSSQSPPDRALFVTFLALLIWLPLPLGSNRPWAWGIMEVWTFGLGLWWSLLYLGGKVHTTAAFRASRPFALLFAAWVLLLVVQLIPFPEAVTSLLSAKSARLYDLLSFGEDHPAAFPISVDTFATEQFLLRTLAYITLFFLALLLLNRVKRLRLAIHALVLCGVFEAVYGGVTALQSLEVATGTFVNRNHLAGYLEICLALGLGLLMADVSDKESLTWRQRIRDFAQWTLSPKMRLRVYLAVMVVGLVLTRSRMGNAAFFIALIVTGVLWMIALRRRPKRSALLILVSIFLIDIYILGSWFGLDEVVNRLKETNVATEQRDEISRDTLSYARNYPLLGSGGGTFYTAYPQFRGADVVGNFVYDQAHNDYLQIAAETGMVGLGLMAGVVLLALWSSLRAIFTRHDPLMRGVGFGSFMAIFSILLHSTVDFNLQIASNAALFMLALAFAWIARNHPRHAAGGGEVAHPSRDDLRDWDVFRLDQYDPDARRGFDHFTSLSGGPSSGRRQGD